MEGQETRGKKGARESEVEEEEVGASREDRQRQEEESTENPDRAVGKGAHLFTCSHDFLQVIFRRESLHRC